MNPTHEWDRRAPISPGGPTLLWRLSTIAALPLTLLLVACAHHPVAARCDGRLQPINPPAPIHAEDGHAARPDSQQDAPQASGTGGTPGRSMTKEPSAQDAALDRASPMP